MNKYEGGLKLIEESCSNGKDNVIALATIAMAPNAAASMSVREI